jgi:hypothetical protein
MKTSRETVLRESFFAGSIALIRDGGDGYSARGSVHAFGIPHGGRESRLSLSSNPAVVTLKTSRERRRLRTPCTTTAKGVRESDCSTVGEESARGDAWMLRGSCDPASSPWYHWDCPVDTTE